ncbi:hypothetical protein DAMDJJ_09115 [Cupriavidus necator]
MQLPRYGTRNGGTFREPAAEACRDIQRFAEAAGLPVATAFRRQDLFDNRHPNYAGNIGLGMSR